MAPDEGLQNLLEKVSAMYDVDPQQVSGKGKNTRLREDRFINARHVFCAVAYYRHPNYSRIAKFLGMDHSSVQWYIKERPLYDNTGEIIEILTDSPNLIKETAMRLARDPNDEYLQKQILRLITNQLKE